MSRYRTLLSLGAVVLVVSLASLIASGAFGTSLSKRGPSPQATPISYVCAPLGGCEIRERFADGSQATDPLRLTSYTDVEVRCEYDLQRHSELIYFTGIRHDAHGTTVGLAFGR
jgi:hypothetical protein